MKQVLLLGDQSRWQAQTEFVHDLLNFTGVRVMIVNIGPGTSKADLNAEDVRYLFEASTLAESVVKMTKKLFGQGVIDGIICLGGQDNPVCHAAFAALPYGIPKVQADYGYCNCPGDITWFQLPGSSGNFNPLQKIALSNAVFALSGMTLNNICNYGTSQALVALVDADAKVAEWLVAKKYHYTCFERQDPMLPKLVQDGHIHGALIFGWTQPPALSRCIEAATAREVPTVVAVEDTDLAAARSAGIKSPSIIIAYPGSGSPCGRLAPIKHDYGTVKFALAAAGMLNQLFLL